MSRIQFERRKRKKGYLIPLFIIVLLYFMIPIFLINKGNDLLAKADVEMKKSDIFSPPIEFYNGTAFLSTAAAFPGFGGWSGTIKESSIEQMISQQEVQFEKLCKNMLNKTISDSIEISFNKENDPWFINIKELQSDSSKANIIELNDSTLRIVNINYCEPWTNFFEKTKTDKSLLHSFCEK